MFYNSIYRLSYIAGRPASPQYFRQVGAYEHYIQKVVDCVLGVLMRCDEWKIVISKQAGKKPGEWSMKAFNKMGWKFGLHGPVAGGSVA